MTLRRVWRRIGLLFVIALLLAQPFNWPASAATGQGYWFVGADGGVFAYGSSVSKGSTGGSVPDPVTAIAATSDGEGYWLTSSTGTVYIFGNAPFYGSAANLVLNS